MPRFFAFEGDEIGGLLRLQGDQHVSCRIFAVKFDFRVFKIVGLVRLEGEMRGLFLFALLFHREMQD